MAKRQETGSQMQQDSDDEVNAKIQFLSKIFRADNLAESAEDDDGDDAEVQ